MRVGDGRRRERGLKGDWDEIDFLHVFGCGGASRLDGGRGRFRLRDGEDRDPAGADAGAAGVRGEDEDQQYSE